MHFEVVHQGQTSKPETKQEFNANEPLPREAHTAVLYNGNIVIFGGRTFSTNRTKNFLNDVWSYSISNNSWECLSNYTPPEDSTAPARRQNHICVLYNDTMILFAGQGDKEQYFDDVWSFDLLNRAWSKIPTTNTPPSRHAHSALLWNDQLIVFGGRDSHQKANYSNEVHSLDINTKNWTILECTGKAPSWRSYHGASLLHTKEHMLVFGGYFWDGTETYYNDVHVLHLPSLNWTQVKSESKPASSRNRHVQVAITTPISTKIIIHGGNYLSYEQHKDIFYNDVWQIDFDEKLSSKWTEVPASGQSVKRGNHSATYNEDNNSIYLIGGELTRSRFSDVIRIKLD